MGNKQKWRHTDIYPFAIVTVKTKLRIVNRKTKGKTKENTAAAQTRGLITHSRQKACSRKSGSVITLTSTPTESIEKVYKAAMFETAFAKPLHQTADLQLETSKFVPNSSLLYSHSLDSWTSIPPIAMSSQLPSACWSRSSAVVPTSMSSSSPASSSGIVVVLSMSELELCFFAFPNDEKMNNHSSRLVNNDSTYDWV